jgi:polysaccharide export outer membrane protein
MVKVAGSAYPDKGQYEGRCKSQTKEPFAMPSLSGPTPNAAPRGRLARLGLGTACLSLLLTGCAGGGMGRNCRRPRSSRLQEGPGEEYVIGPLDELTIFVWRNPELGASVQVRPDGRITTPLITDMPAVGKTPSMLAEDIKLQLSQYIQEPIVSVIVNKFAGTFSQQVRSSAPRKSRPRSPIAPT